MRQGQGSFEWDEGNESELARHHIAPEEVEQLFDNDPVWAANKRNRPGNRLMIGRTNSSRELTIVVRIQPETEVIRAITGWESTRGERTSYRR
jgi:uncharacterized DUF497 family protein